MIADRPPKQGSVRGGLPRTPLPPPTRAGVNRTDLEQSPREPHKPGPIRSIWRAHTPKTDVPPWADGSMGHPEAPIVRFGTALVRN